MGVGSRPAQLALDIVERAADDALTQRLRLLWTCIVVLAGLLPRMTFDAIQAYANIAVTKSTAVDCGVCDSCQSATWYEPQSSQRSNIVAQSHLPQAHERMDFIQPPVSAPRSSVFDPLRPYCGPAWHAVLYRHAASACQLFSQKACQSRDCARTAGQGCQCW